MVVMASWLAVELAVATFVVAGILGKVISPVNHSDPIVVTTPVVAVPESEIEVEHENEGTENISYAAALLALMKTDPVTTFSAYRDVLAADPSAYNDCHAVAHQLGHVAYETYGFAKAMSYQDAICGGGFIHGIVEAKFGEMDEVDLLQEIATTCDAATDEENCVHGVGHGLMLVTYLDVDRSLSYCDLFDASVRHHCFDGVWMHVFDQEESGVAHADTMVLTDSYIQSSQARCVATADVYKDSCYFYLPRIFAHDAERTFYDLVSLCGSVERIGRFACAAGAGHSTMKYHIADPVAVYSSCEVFDDETLIEACHDGASRYYLHASNPLTEDLGNDADTCLVLPEGVYRERCETARMRR